MKKRCMWVTCPMAGRVSASFLKQTAMQTTSTERKYRIDRENARAVINQYASTKNQKELAEMLNTSPTTVRKILADMNVRAKDFEYKKASCEPTGEMFNIDTYAKQLVHI